MEHTKEPWICGEGDNAAKIYAEGGRLYIVNGMDIENASRLVLCVNACTGIPDDVLAGAMHHGVDPLQMRITELELQRDKLLKALEVQHKAGRAVIDSFKFPEDVIMKHGIGTCKTCQLIAEIKAAQ